MFIIRIPELNLFKIAIKFSWLKLILKIFHRNRKKDYLNQKEPVQFSLGKQTEPSASTNVLPTTSRTACSSELSTPVVVSQATPEDDNIRRLKQLKLSSITSSGSLQLMYKKKLASAGKERREREVASPVHGSASNGKLGDAATQNQKSRSGAGVRSRSHSRSKYTAYFASAASAIRSAMIRTSPCSSCKTVTISTQTSLENKNGSFD